MSIEITPDQLVAIEKAVGWPTSVKVLVNDECNLFHHADISIEMESVVDGEHYVRRQYISGLSDTGFKVIAEHMVAKMQHTIRTHFFECAVKPSKLSNKTNLYHRKETF